MTDMWLCIRVNMSYHHGDRNAITSAINKIFGNDLKEMQFVCDEVMWQSGEYFCFVRCDNYAAHIQMLKDHALFFGVIPSCDKPSWLSTDDVNKFIASVQKSTSHEKFTRGDIVSVREGYLKDLYGLIIGKHRKKYKISFHFFIRQFIEHLPADSLQFTGNLFKDKRFPITRRSLEEGRVPAADPELQEALHKIASDHKRHWKKNRGRI